VIFDTLLGVYTGAEVSSLNEEASDEDRGGFLTSQVIFNAVQTRNIFSLSMAMLAPPAI